MASKRSKVLKDLDKTLDLHRFPGQLWSILLLPYVPIGLLLVLLRVCLSLQAVLILLIFPEGRIKRYMLRVFFGVLGVVVVTEGQSREPKLYISNKLSYIDHLVLHLATDCVTVNTSECLPPLASLFQHLILKGKDSESLEERVKSLPEFDEHVADYTPYAIQPEFMPTNGSHMLLQFSTWPFTLDSSVQPVALKVFRPLPIKVTTAKSSGWWDLFWTLFVPFTYFHVKFMAPVEKKPTEDSTKFAKSVQLCLASELKIEGSDLTEKEVEKWFADPPVPPTPPPPPKPSMPQGPIIPVSEFDPTELSSMSSLHSSPEVEAMVQQVTAVLPQVPHAAIRKDLLKTRSVDVTITNILEGRVQYQTTPTTTYTTSASNSTKRKTKPASASSGLFGAKQQNTKSLSRQRQLSFEERKKQLLDQARKRYLEKHGL